MRGLAARRHRRAGQRQVRRRAGRVLGRPHPQGRDLHARHAWPRSPRPSRRGSRRAPRLDGRGARGAHSLPELLAADLPAPPDPWDEDAVAHLSYTSGTTGRPKGACLAHEPTVRAANCIAERLRITSDDVSFGPTALSSSYQLVGNLLPPLHRGATVNVMAKWTQVSGWD